MEAVFWRGQRSKTHNTVLVEADELIQSWLDGVDKTSSENDDACKIPRYTWASGATGPLSVRKAPTGHEAALWQKIPELVPLSEGEVDISARVEWEEGDVRDNARAVVEGLLQKTLRGVDEPEKRVSSKRATCADPRITMELRHKQVSERRRLKDLERAKSRELLERAKEAQRMAEALVKREEEERKKRTKAEEALLREQMAAIRREMQGQKEAERLLMVSVQDDPPVLSVVEQGEWLISEDARVKRITATRTALLEQLAEAEALETKTNLKVLSQYFSCWQGAVARQRACARKAAAVGDWKLLVKSWRAWRGYVRKQRDQKEQVALARELQREKIHIDLACQRYRTVLLLKCLTAWRVWSKTRRLEKRAVEERHICQEKMAALLKVVSQPSTIKPPVVTLQEHHQTVARKQLPNEAVVKTDVGQGAVPSVGQGAVPSAKHSRPPEPSVWQVARQHVDNILAEAVKNLDKRTKMEEEEEEEEILDNAATEHKGTDQLTTSGGRRSPSHVKELELKSTDMCPSHGGREPSSRAEGCVLQPQDHIPPSHTPSLPIEGCAPQPFAIPPPDSAQAISSNAPPANLPIGHSATAMARGSTNGSRSLVQHSSKPPTKPITMTGMEARARELAHRREEREHARKVKEMERLLQLQREQQERERADREAKEVMAAQKREEKRLAKQQELELQRKQEMLVTMNNKALCHYRLGHLRRWGVCPWKRLVQAVREGQQMADNHYHLRTLKEAWLTWGHAMARRTHERDKMADDFFKRQAVRRAWRAWMEYVTWCRQLETLPVQHRERVVIANVLRAWVRFVKEEATREYEGEKKAQLHYQRALQKSVFHGWRRYLPLSREEKTRELRKAELRRKVSAWLPDYQPREFMEDTPHTNHDDIW